MANSDNSEEIKKAQEEPYKGIKPGRLEFSDGPSTVKVVLIMFVVVGLFFLLAYFYPRQMHFVGQVLDSLSTLMR